MAACSMGLDPSATSPQETAAPAGLVVTRATHSPRAPVRISAAALGAATGGATTGGAERGALAHTETTLRVWTTGPATTDAALGPDRSHSPASNPTTAH